MMPDPRTAAIEALAPWYPIGFLVAIALGLYFTPILRDGARNFGIVDRPDGNLKTHEQPVAYLGGLAVYVAFVVSLGLMPVGFNDETLALMLGGSLVLILGLIDDLKALSPTVKFLGQLLAAFVLLKSGIKIQPAFLPPLAGDIVTVLWIVTITNAFNIVDVMDGLCSGVGAVSMAGLFAVALLNGGQGIAEGASVALFIACFVGALIGFLKFNFRPAQIYLGDAGSMLIGFFCGSIAMMLQYSAGDPLAISAPLFILGVPLFDLGLVIVLRLRQGKSPFRGSPDHFAVRLKRHGWEVATIVRTAWLANLALAAFGVALTRLDFDTARVAIGCVVAALIFVGFLVSRVGGTPAPVRTVAVGGATGGASSSRSDDADLA